MPLALAALVVLILACPSQANTRAENERIRSVMPLARVLWGDYPCRGREVVRVARDEELLGEGGWHGSGAAHKSSCRIWLSKDSVRRGYRSHLCQVLTHEIGHLVLAGTSSDHRSRANHGIMRGRGHPLCDLA